jgi:hypothetical protein
MAGVSAASAKPFGVVSGPTRHFPFMLGIDGSSKVAAVVPAAVDKGTPSSGRPDKSRSQAVERATAWDLIQATRPRLFIAPAN